MDLNLKVFQQENLSSYLLFDDNRVPIQTLEFYVPTEKGYLSPNDPTISLRGITFFAGGPVEYLLDQPPEYISFRNIPPIIKEINNDVSQLIISEFSTKKICESSKPNYYLDYESEHFIYTGLDSNIFRSIDGNPHHYRYFVIKKNNNIF